MQKVTSLDDDDEISDIELKPTKTPEAPPSEPVKEKRQMTKKQQDAWTKCMQARDAQRSERKMLLEAYNKKMEDELNAKIMKKAQAIKKKAVKQQTQKLLKDEIENSSDEEIEIIVKPKRKPTQKQVTVEHQTDQKDQKDPIAPVNQKPVKHFVWC
jgi:hypothetical protein